LTKALHIKHYDKVYELYSDLGMPIAQDSQFTIHSLLDIHSSIPYKSPVFRANYYSFIFIKNGKGNYTTDNQTFEYEDRTVYFTNPGHLKAFEFYSLSEGYLITLSEQFLNKYVHKAIFEQFPFLLAETIPPQTFNKADFNDIALYYTQILKEYEGKSANKNQIVGSLFSIILLKLKEQFWAEYQPVDDGNRSSVIVKQFKQLLEKHYRDLENGKTNTQFKAKHYAHELNINSSYLNAVIKSKTGKPVSRWIADKTINQAEALLAHSSKTIKEVGVQLGFSELAHFSNFFKKNTGATPTEYRSKLSQYAE